MTTQAVPCLHAHLLLQAQRAREPRVAQHVGMVPCCCRCLAPAAHNALQLGPPLQQHLVFRGEQGSAVRWIGRGWPQDGKTNGKTRRLSTVCAAGLVTNMHGRARHQQLGRAALPIPRPQHTLACSAACRLSASVAATTAVAAAPSPPPATPSSSSSSKNRATHSAAASKSSRARADWMPSTACMRSSTREMWPSVACTRDCAVSNSRTW